MKLGMQTSRPDIATYGEAFLFGLFVPSGLLYLLLSIELSQVGDLILLPWLGATFFGAIALAKLRSHPPGAILGGGIIGVVVGWLLLFLITGSDLVLLVLGFSAAAGMAGAAIVSVIVDRSWAHRDSQVTAIAGSLVILSVVIILGLVISGP